MAKHIFEMFAKTNDLKKSMATLYIVQDEIRKQIQANIERAKKDLEYHTSQANEFKSFLNEIVSVNNIEKAHPSGRGWDGILKEDR